MEDFTTVQGLLPPLNGASENINQFAPKRSFFNPLALKPETGVKLRSFLQGFANAPTDGSQGWGGMLNASVNNGANQLENLRQNNMNYNAYKPFFEQQGINTDSLNPAFGGSGFGEIKPMDMLKAQDLSEYRNAMLDNKTQQLKQQADLIDLREKLGLGGLDIKNKEFGLKQQFQPYKIAESKATAEALIKGLGLKGTAQELDKINTILGGVEKGVIDANSVGNIQLPQIPSGQTPKGLPPISQLTNTNIPIGQNGKPIKLQNPTPKVKQTTQGDTASLGAIKQQLDRFSGTFKVMPSKTNAYTMGAIRKATGTQTPAEANFNAQSTLLFNRIARDLGGEKGVLSDQDIARVKESMPTLNDSLAQKNAKMKAIYSLLNDRAYEANVRKQQPQQVELSPVEQEMKRRGLL